MTIKIGVLHSTAVSSLMQDNFIEGLQAGGRWDDISLESDGEEGKYGKGSNNQTLSNLDDAANRLADSCDFLVALSLVAVIAVNNVTHRKPAVGMIGRMPKNNTEPGWQATQPGSTVEAIVNLDSAAHNAERATRLTQAPFNVPANEIALMVNTNSAMGQNEYDEWILAGGKGIRFPNDAQMHDNNHAHFGQFFRNIPSSGANKISGIIVSSDPFFFRFRTRLIKAALAARPATTPIKFCFPFAEWQYKDSGPGHNVGGWDSNIHIGYCGTGTDLLPAYRQLGVAADGVLSAHFPAPAVFTSSGSKWKRT
jgi:hypothetical protein